MIVAFSASSSVGLVNHARTYIGFMQADEAVQSSTLISGSVCRSSPLASISYMHLCLFNDRNSTIPVNMQVLATMLWFPFTFRVEINILWFSWVTLPV